MFRTSWPCRILANLLHGKYLQRRQMKNELETLRKVEDLQHESAEEARQLLNANGRDAARRRAISGLSDREALLLAQREHNTARLRSLAAHPQANVSPNISMHLPASPSLATYGAVPIIHVPSSSNMLGAGLQLGGTSTPRVRSLSTHHTPTIALAPFTGSSQPHLSVASPHVPLIGVHSSPSLGPMSRPRAVSSVGIGGSATSERIRLEERKRAVLQKEADLQEARERRLLAKKSMLDLDAHELALKKKVQELDARAKLESHERFLDDQEARLQQRQRDQLMEAEMVDRLNSLSVNVRKMVPAYRNAKADLIFLVAPA